MAETWSNWSGLIECAPRRQLRIGSEVEALAAIAEARREGLTVRPRGSGHSCTPICASDGLLLSFEGLDGVVEADAAAGRARIRAGAVIHDIGEPLWQAGLALANQGDVDVQTLAGALGTGTHGTGVTLGNLSSMIEEMRLATARGEVVTLSRADDPERLDAAAVSLGALGLVLEATLALVPRYRLHETNRAMAAEDCIAAFPELQGRHRNLEFFWVPGLDQCVLKALDPTEAPVTAEDVAERPVAPPGTLERYLRPERVDWSHRIYPTARRVRFNEMEFAVTLADGLACFAEIRQMMRARFPEVAWAVEYRTLAADEAFLSQAHGRATATISIHETVERDCRAFFEAAQAIFLEHGGRPHWGKVHYLGARELRGRYPRWDDFLALREELDPDGRFLNDHLRQVFGV